MPPKFDPNEVYIINLRAIGGEAAGQSSLAPKVGPLGLAPKKVADDIAAATKDWKGQRVTVQLSVQNRKATVSVVPTASALLIKALKEPPREGKKEKGAPGRKHHGNITWDDLMGVVKVMRKKSLALTAKGTTKEILGTAVSLGCTIEGKSARAMLAEVEAGDWDDKIISEDKCEKPKPK